MKSFVSAIALAGFLTVALFGFAQLSNMEHGKCVAETYAGTVCHVMATSEQFSFHIGAFLSFLSSTASSTFAMLLGLALMMFVLALRLFVRPVLVPVLIISRNNYRTAGPPRKRKLLHFLSLFEHSPSHF
jgi:hypothetical protein